MVLGVLGSRYNTQYRSTPHGKYGSALSFASTFDQAERVETRSRAVWSVGYSHTPGVCGSFESSTNDPDFERVLHMTGWVGRDRQIGYKPPQDNFDFLFRPSPLRVEVSD